MCTHACMFYLQIRLEKFYFQAGMFVYSVSRSCCVCQAEGMCELSAKEQFRNHRVTE